jgi:hypothetical protein
MTLPSGRAELEGLMAALEQLPELPPLDRARVARALTDVAKSTLSAVGDAAVVEALDGVTQADVATALGVTPAAVSKAVVRHRSRLA